MEIDFLANHRHHVPELANCYYRQWGVNYSGVSEQDIVQSVAAHANRDKIPLALVALDNNNFAGAVGLRANDMRTKPELTPWLAGLYVKPRYRGVGLGSRLVLALEATAANLGIRTLYLYTADSEAFYRRMDWVVIGREIYLDDPVSIMKKDILL